MSLLSPGVSAPEFSLPNQDGDAVALSALRSQKVLLWFFSRAGGSN